MKFNLSYTELEKLVVAAICNVRDVSMDTEGFILENLQRQDVEHSKPKFSKLTLKNQPAIGQKILYEGNLKFPCFGVYIGENKVKNNGKIDLFDKWAVIE